MKKSIIQKLFTPYYGQNRISRFIRKRIEYRHIQELVGLPLAGLAFFGAVVVPQTQAAVSSAELYLDAQKTTIQATVTDSRFSWPMASFGISQYFSGYHRGVDLMDPAGTPVFPIADGTVIATGWSLWGYGKHVIVQHEDNIQSLYAHLSTITVAHGEQVTKSTQLGGVGATGWATGNHLHLEVIIDGVQTNPMDVLPGLQTNAT